MNKLCSKIINMLKWIIFNLEINNIGDLYIWISV